MRVVQEMARPYKTKKTGRAKFVSSHVSFFNHVTFIHPSCQNITTHVILVT